MSKQKTDILMESETVFRFTIGGQKIQLTEAQADTLVEHVRRWKEAKKIAGVETVIASTRQSSSPVGQHNRPAGYTRLFEKETTPRNGKNALTYVYYENLEGELGFQVKRDGNVISDFLRLGKINETDSPIGRFLRGIPSDQTVNSAYFKKHKIQTNAQRTRAMLDLLEYKGHLTPAPDMDDFRTKSNLLRLSPSNLKAVQKSTPETTVA